jgi:hypothetical protein
VTYLARHGVEVFDGRREPVSAGDKIPQ